MRYRVDYFRYVIAGADWRGKEFFTAACIEHARDLARRRGAQLGYVVDIHQGWSTGEAEVQA